jgi:hypothetical protein
VPEFEKILWPPNLQEVTLSGFFPNLPYDWRHFVRDWPPSLQHLILDNCCGLGFVVDGSSLIAKTNDKLRSVSITDRNSQMYFQNMVLTFSGLQSLSLPANLARTNYDSYPVRPVLGQLTIRATSGKGPHHFDLADLLDHVNSIPSLQQIRLHSSLVERGCSTILMADELLKSRATVQNQATEESTTRPGSFGVHVFDD